MPYISPPTLTREEQRALLETVLREVAAGPAGLIFCASAIRVRVPPLPSSAVQRSLEKGSAQPPAGRSAVLASQEVQP
jgi:hypothetical protein